MEWYQLVGIVFGSGVIVALINQIGSAISEKRKRKDFVADKADEEDDKLGKLNTKVERYKIETDKEILEIRRDITAMDERFQEIFTNLDLKLDDSLRHVSKGNALLLAQSINSIAYRANKIIKKKSIDEDEYRNLNVEYCRVCELIGIPDDPDVVYLTGLIKKVESLRM